MGYMKNSVVQYYYDKLTASPTQQHSAFLWWSILSQFFKFKDGYGAKLDLRSVNGELQPNIIISYLDDDDVFNSVILIDFGKEKEFAEGETADQSSVWEEVIQRLTIDIKAARAERGDNKELHAIATVGTLSRFFCFAPDAEQLTDSPIIGSQILEFRRDKRAIKHTLHCLIWATSVDVMVRSVVRNRSVRVSNSPSGNSDGNQISNSESESAL
ncbi:hypothetical protein PRK78_002730 [Emydomyces testavorans]|uniref:Uncharacterized protein n=1 Tax=Emydomyces testavorans TaxID=2070801 RepID=A0AAF0IGT1_9EURO|nr:hypothetical protein PRK78_002730 [Emydomyces testavorans]